MLQVRSLEQKNKLLEAEIEAYQGRFEKPTGLRLLYEEQLKELKRIADQMKVQRVRQHFTNCILPILFIFFFNISNTQLGMAFYASLICLYSSNNTRPQLGVFKVLYLVTGLFLAGKWRDASVTLGVAEYSCHQRCFSHR